MKKHQRDFELVVGAISIQGHARTDLSGHVRQVTVVNARGETVLVVDASTAAAIGLALQAVAVCTQQSTPFA